MKNNIEKNICGHKMTIDQINSRPFVSNFPRKNLFLMVWTTIHLSFRNEIFVPYSTNNILK